MKKIPVNDLRYYKYISCISVLIIIISVIFLFCNVSGLPSGTAWNQVPQILKQIVPPVFPDKDFTITDYGAVGDGNTDCTDAFRKAIEECNAQGGGRVVVPEGKYLTGAIHLKSNVNLYISKSAEVLFSREKEKFLPAVKTRFEGVECLNILH